MDSGLQSKNVRILLAEDNLVNQLLIKKVIEKAGFYLELANNGIQALEKLSQNKFDLVLMDVQMPDMNGLETTNEIIRIYKEDRPKILAITAGSFGDDEQQCIDAGMDDTLEKPFKIEQLLDKMKKLQLI
jgi:CheY-like chemotaxis protein